MNRDDVSLLGHALWYQGMGWSVIPLCDADHTHRGPACRAHPTKKRGKIPLLPAWKEFQERRASAEELREWWRQWPHANVGVVMGRISGMVGWDVEDKPALEMLERMHGGPLPPTLVFWTGSGTRYLFSWPDEWPLPKAQFDTPLSTLVLLGEGSYSVFPPSVHLNGKRYEWAGACRPGEAEIATLPISLVRAIEAHKRGWREQKTRVGGEVPHAGETDYWYRRARGWAQGAPGAVQGQGGHKRVFALACQLIHTFHQTPESAARLMAEFWSPRCDPPWTYNEIARECRGALERGASFEMPDKGGSREHESRTKKGGKAQEKAQAPAAGQQTAADSPPAPSVPGQAPQVDPPEYAAGSSRRPEYVLASDLERSRLEWFVEPWIPAARLTAISGAPGSGKSTLGAWLIAQAGLAVALPGNEEEAGGEFAERLEAAGADPRRVAVLNTRRWTFPGDRDRLADVVRKVGARLVWIDPIDSYMGHDVANSADAVTGLLDSLAWVAMRTGAPVCFVRHPGKAAGNLLPGSVKWSAVPRAVLELVTERGKRGEGIIRPSKASRGREAPPTYYRLQGEGDGPRLWAWGEPVRPSLVEEITDETDRMFRRKIDRAVKMLKSVLEMEWVRSPIVLRMGLEEGLNERVLQRAMERLDGDYHRAGVGVNHRCWWGIPGYTKGERPTDDSVTDTPPSRG